MKTKRNLILPGLVWLLGLALTACGAETPAATLESKVTTGAATASNANLTAPTTVNNATVGLINTTTAASKPTAVPVSPTAAPAAPPTPLKVTPLTATEIEQISSAMHTYANNRAAGFVKSTENFVKAVKTHDIGKAKAAYEAARLDYATIDLLMGEFKELASAIDGQAEDFPAGEKDQNWGGFHALEKSLFVDIKLTSRTDKLADQLLQDVTTLQGQIKTMELEPDFVLTELMNMLEENQLEKLPGDTEAYSHLELASLRGNLQTARFVLDTFAAPLKNRNASVASEVRKSLDELDGTMNGLFNGPRATDYSKLDDLTRRHLAQKFEGLTEAFSKVAGNLGLKLD